MANLIRIRAALSGWDGGPGVNTWYFSPGTSGAWGQQVVQGAWDEVHAFYTQQRALCVNTVRVNVEAECAEIEPETGNIIEMWIADTSAGIISMTGTDGKENRATQVVCGLKTGKWVNGRQLQGRLFIGPANGGVLDTTGRIPPQTQGDIQDGFSAMITGIGVRLAVYSRPKDGGLRKGYYEDVQTVQVSDKPGILRSRRD